VRVLVADLEQVWRGGQEQAFFLMEGLRARGHAAELLSVRGAALAERSRAAGIPVHAISPRARRLAAARLLRSLLRAQAYDILHANEAHALTASWFAGAHRRMAVVVSRRVAFPLRRHFLARAQYGSARRMIAVSRFVAQSALDSGMPAGSVAVVYDGVEMPYPSSQDLRRRARARWGAGEGQPLLGCVGHLLPEKGQEFLVRALPAIRSRFAEVRLVLAGDGRCRVLLERLARELGVEDAVCFAGEVTDIAEVYRALDIFIFPSLAEPLGSSMLTAMAWGLPVIAAAGGAVPEVIAADENGVLVPAGDAAAISAAALRLLADGEMRARLGQNARRVVEQCFTAGHMVEATLEIYSGVLGTSGDAAEIRVARG
jgi:glycosyltransferase involved in cell wall biosynthesis